MALVACPACKQRISDKAESCQHCGFVFGGDVEGEERANPRIERIKKSSQLMTQAFIALIVFIAGIAYSGFYAESGETWDKWLSQGLSALGFIWFITTRVRIMIFKKGNK